MEMDGSSNGNPVTGMEVAMAMVAMVMVAAATVAVVMVVEENE